MIRIQQIDNEFDEGKRYLDNRNYSECIDVYDGLISFLEKREGNAEFKGILEASLNNRGVAKCKLALSSNDLKLYADGLADLETSVGLSSAKTEHEKAMLIAYGNLVFGKKEFQEFSKAKGENLQSANKNKQTIA